MFLPEYAITGNTLKNIASSEYARAIIETTTLLPNWTTQLEKDATTRTIYFSLMREGLNINFDIVKRFVSGLPTSPTVEMKNYQKALDVATTLSRHMEINEADIKAIYLCFNKNLTYRSAHMERKLPAPEILAELSAVIDWYNSLDAKETHPLVSIAIFKARIEYIAPFEVGNSILSDLLANLCLKTFNYNIKGFYAMEEYFMQTRRTYLDTLYDANKNDDFTRWIDYFTEGFSREITSIAENVKMLARDIKIARAAGDEARLSQRQEKIIEYLQDFGMLQNTDFPKLFPSISEDTVLRELKGLMDKNIVVKKGKTKSSHYELT